MYTDCHIHLNDLAERVGDALSIEPSSIVCSSSWNEREFLWNEAFAKERPGRVLVSFGVHPQEPDPSTLGFLERLLSEGRVHAIGEAGFDRFEARYSSDIDRQRFAWDAQLELANRYEMPLIVHCRKALDLVFADSPKLSGLRSVIFHGWPGSAVEAASLLRRGVNAYFSCGKGLLRVDRSLAETARSVPLDRLLTETDAPWMTLKGEAYSVPADVSAVTKALADIRGIPVELCERSIADTFHRAFFRP